jgi:hypothetical protein
LSWSRKAHLDDAQLLTAAQTVFPAIRCRHSADEHAFVLDGDVDFDDRTLCAGDCAVVGALQFPFSRNHARRLHGVIGV